MGDTDYLGERIKSCQDKITCVRNQCPFFLPFHNPPLTLRGCTAITLVIVPISVMYQTWTSGTVSARSQVLSKTITFTIGAPQSIIIQCILDHMSNIVIFCIEMY